MKVRSLFTSDTLPVWFIILSFGPYVFPSFGIRTEHLLTYSILPFGILILTMNKRPFFYDPPLFAIFMLISVITILTIHSTIFGYDEIIYNTTVGKIISHAEKYLRPLAVIIILCAFFNINDEHRTRRALINVSKALICMLAINSILVITQLFVDLSLIMRPFTVGMGADYDGDVQSVAELGAMMGRFTGIFNQPAEAGLSYALGLFAWAYLKSLNKKIRVNFKASYLFLGLILVGGFFSISKIFIIIGIPLFVVYLLMINRHARILNFKLFSILLIGSAVIGWVVISGDQGSYNRFHSLFTLIGGINNLSINGLTGGRFGDAQSGVSEKFEYVWAHDPIYGLGFASYTCIDNGFLEFFAQGGLVCLFGYFAVLISMALIALKYKNNEEGRLFMFIVALILGAGVGIPPLTSNRFSPIIWVFIFLIYFVFYSKKVQYKKN